MKKEKYVSWDTYFMSIAIVSSFRSKDPKTQTGACIADADRKIIGVGYNGLPRGCGDDEGFWKDDDNDVYNSKHSYVIHAEKNAILNSITRDLRGASIYVTLRPCDNCAQAIVQVGIRKVVYLNAKEGRKHGEIGKAVERMFGSAGVELVRYDGLDVKDKNFIGKLEELKKKF